MEDEEYGTPLTPKERGRSGVGERRVMGKVNFEMLNRESTDPMGWLKGSH